MLKVIIIDDEQWSLDYMRGIIDWGKNGAEIIGEFKTAKQALRFMESNRDVDLVFLDVEMPKTGGIELLRKVGGTLPKTDFVFISSHDKFEYVREAMRYRATDYLLKPIDKKDILRILKCAKKSREQNVSEMAQRAQIGIFSADIQKRADEIWGNGEGMLTACFVCEALEEATIGHLKKFFDDADIYCYRSVLYNSFFIRTDKPTLDAFLADARGGCGYRLGVYVSENGGEKLNNMLIKAQSAYDGLWFCDTANVCVFDEDSEKLLLKYVMVTSKCLEDGRTNEAFESVDGFVKEMRAKTLQGRAVILFVNKLIEFLMLHFDGTEDLGEYQLIDISHAKKRFGTADKLIDFLHSLIYEYGAAGDNAQALRAKDFVPLIKKYIEENYQSDLNLSVLAKEFMMSGKYLSSVFKKATGMNLNRYINLVRIQRAEVMLRETEISVQDISYLCGYGDCSYFTKVFRDIVGEKPSEYRENRL